MINRSKMLLPALLHLVWLAGTYAASLKITTSCPAGTVTTFIRIPRGVVMGIPTTVSQLEALSCAEFCRNNSESTANLKRLCQGFNYIDNITPSCELFDENAQVGPINRNVGVRSFYYDKTCLSGAQACRQRPYAFEYLPDSQLQGNVLKTITAPDYSSCLSACLDENNFVCQSVNFNQARRTCELSRFSRRNKLHDFRENVPGTDYFENNCLTKESRCSSGELYFVKSFDAEIEGFDLTQVQESLTNCLQKCLQSDQIFCRSAEYDRQRKECIISDEDSLSVPELVKTTTNSGTDLYEPVCLSAIGSETTALHCKRPFLFEKVINFALNVPSNFRILSGMTAEDCMTACARDNRCKSMNFNHRSQTCMLSEFDRKNGSVTLIANREIDYYENNCFSIREVKGCFFTLQGSSRQVRREFRSQVITTNSALECKMACVDSNCRTVSYSGALQLCYQSELDPSTVTFTQLTEVNGDFETFAKGDCVVSQDFRQDDILTGLDGVPHSPLPHSPIDTCRFERTAGRSLAGLYRADEFRVRNLSDCHAMCLNVQTYTCRAVSFAQPDGNCYLSEFDLTTIAIDSLTQPAKDADFYVKTKCSKPLALGQGSPFGSASPPSPPTANSVGPTGYTAITEPVGPVSPAFSVGPPAQIFTPSPGSPPGISPAPSAAGTTPFAPGGMQVAATCSQDGVNITVAAPKAYTGAIYAAERFSFCRNLITQQSSFWLFLPRPSINSACNTIMVNNVLQGVVVISFDNIIPYDVTTKDDLFYQITCDYSTISDNPSGGRVVVTSGLVIGRQIAQDSAETDFSGPTPRVISGSGSGTAVYDATLKILRNGAPVQNVLIGEQLTLAMDSSADPSKMQILTCNVSRVGGSGPAPEPLTIVDNGCPQVLQVIGPIEKSSKGLQATLTAFRIDGSAEIQFSCLVQFCPQTCPPVTCPKPDGSTFKSLGRKRRKTEFVLADNPQSSNIVESVNGRLKVFVEGEEGAPQPGEISGTTVVSAQNTKGCIPEHTFVAVTSALCLLILLFIVGFICVFCRRSWMVALQQKLISDSSWAKPRLNIATGSTVSTAQYNYQARMARNSHSSRPNFSRTSKM